MHKKFVTDYHARPAFTTLAVLGAACITVSFAGLPARADVGGFTLRQPLSSATVRETVPIRIARNLLNQAGYVTITIDGQFRGAPAVPASGDVVYEWDTKHTGGNNDQESPDGKHVIQVGLYDKDSNEIAIATASVRVLNKITTLPDGVRLIYKWRPDEILTYRLHSVLTNQPSGGDSSDTSTTPGQAGSTSIQDVYARLQRSVEDVGSDGVLVRDRFSGGTYGTSPLTAVFSLASKYTTIDRNGSVLVQNQPIGSGLHYGYGFDEFPDRRVSAGDSWQTQMMVSLPWAIDKMTTVRGQARLDDFEWENGYPAAKIVETYTGPATFRVDSGASGSSGAVGGAPSMGPGAPPTSSSPTGSNDGQSVQASSVTLTRTVWFAYEAGMVVREETKLTANPTGFAADVAELTSPSPAQQSGGTSAGQGAPSMGGAPSFSGVPNFGGAPSMGGAPSFSQQGQGIPGASSAASTETNVQATKTLTLLSIG